MKKELYIITAFLFFSTVTLNGQETKGIKWGMTSEQNLQALVNPSLYSTTTGFDDRYEGVKGSSRLFDTLVHTTLTIKGQQEPFTVNADLDFFRNTMLFILRSSGDLLEFSSSFVKEIVFHTGDKDMVFRTTEGLNFDKELRGNKFFQVLKEGPCMFIKIPDREFREANYTGLYSPDIRYDEYVPSDKYYIMGTDSVFHRVQLTRKSLRKAFPSQAKLITSSFNEKSGEDPEMQVVRLLEKF